MGLDRKKAQAFDAAGSYSAYGPQRWAQLDWGHSGGVKQEGFDRPWWEFTFRLGYTAAAELNPKLGTLLRMHEKAFRQLGGAPEEIFYDRMKVIWQEIDERGEVV